VLLGLSDSRSFLDHKSILAFFDAGHDVLAVGDLDLARTHRRVFFGLGLEPTELGSQVVDFIRHQGDPRTARLASYHKGAPFLAKAHSEALLYRGIAFRTTSYVNNQIYPLLRGRETLAVQREGRIEAAGRGLVLLAAVQGTNNARALCGGSLDFFSDEFFVEGTGNRQYVADLLGWLTHARGTLRVAEVRYGKQGSAQEIAAYTVEDQGWYSVKIEELRDGQYVPFVADGLQLEFIMLDPYLRDNLTMTAPGLYSLQFAVPPQHGIFTFKFELARAGYHFLTDKKRVTVRTKRHDQYPRFLPEAYPYYAALLTVTSSFLLFFLSVLYHQP
jgi:oligosaccharyltransferase complex subunit beta